MSRYVVIGAGAVGVAIAAGLADAGIDVVLVSRGSTYRAIVENGLHYTQNGTTRRLDLPVVDGPDGVDLHRDDTLVLTVKSQDAPATLATWAWRPVTPDTETGSPSTAADLPILLTQNGLDAERTALRYFTTVIGGVAMIAGRHVVPGHIEIGTAPRTGQLIVGAYPSAAQAPHATGAAARIAADLTAANWLASDVARIQRWLAWKALANTTFALSVLDGTTEEIAALREGILAEVRAVLAVADGIDGDIADPAELGYDPTETAIHPAYGEHRPSTWQSFARGAGSEVDYLNGEIALLGRLHGIPTPLNTRLQHVLGASAAHGEGPGLHHAREVLHPPHDTAG